VRGVNLFMKKILGFLLVASVALAADAPPKPKHVNLALELLEQKQPVYYSYGADGYEAGKAAAKTWADLLLYDMEGNAMDFTALRAFMKGLVDAVRRRAVTALLRSLLHCPFTD